jgi:hypothetical protein
MVCRTASHHLGSLNPSQLGHEILALLPGVRVGSGSPNRHSLWCPVHPTLRGRNGEEMRKVDLDSIDEHRVAELMRHMQYEQ